MINISTGWLQEWSLENSIRGKAYIPVQSGQSVQPISRKWEGTHQISFYETVERRPLNKPSCLYGGRA